MSTMLERVLVRCHQLRASDIHLGCYAEPTFRVHGSLVKDSYRLNADDMEAILLALLHERVGSETSASSETLLPGEGSLDFGYSDSEGRRYRINAYRSMGQLTVAIRYLNNSFSTLAELKLPEQIHQLVSAHSGLVLVCGATGSGKSTTLAALMHQINQTRPVHTITIEDPVEFVHPEGKGLVHQRELGRDFSSFSLALKAALREDPDVLMVGEMRDLDTIRAALTAAETGHLVFSTLHTNDAVSSVERLVGAFPGIEQDLARARLSRCLRAVIAQRLLPTSNRQGRIPAVEILLGNSATGNLIENDKTRQLYAVMENHRDAGMQTLDQSLAALVAQRWIEHEEALKHARNPAQFDSLVAQLGNQRGY